MRSACLFLDLFLYPIKSTYGIEVQSAEVGKYGFKYDREWMVIDATNNFVSQRTQPKVRCSVFPLFALSFICRLLTYAIPTLCYARWLSFGLV